MIHHGDCMTVMAAMEPESVDAIVTDPPYGLEFMGKEWDQLDGGLPQESVWKGRRGKGGSNVGNDDTHRYALELTLGRPLAEGMEACHRCDNPPCCNPAHLFEGTRLDNERDKTAKGRRNTRKAA